MILFLRKQFVFADIIYMVCRARFGLLLNQYLYFATAHNTVFQCFLSHVTGSVQNSI